MKIEDIFSSIETLLLGTTDGISKGTDPDSRAGDVAIESITLMSEDQQRKYSLLAQCTAIDIFESIMTPSIFAELTIADSIGLYQSFPIMGEEYVSIRYKTPGSKSVTYLLRVNKLFDKQISDNNKQVTYKLQLVSPELMRNATRVVNRSYKNNIHDVVEDIISDDLGTKKPIHIDKTSGIEEGIITSMQPFVAIDFLRQRAVSREYKSSSYVFYESRDGYWFTTLERLIESGKKSLSAPTDKEFFFDTLRNQNANSITLRNILAYNLVSFGDTITKAQEGGISNDVQSFDLITGDISKIVTKTADNTNTAGFNRKYNENTSTKRIIPIRSDLPDNSRVEKSGQISTYINSILQNITRVYIYGDSDIQIGDVIRCTIPVMEKAETSNYLITKVRHMILNNDRPQHTIALELVKCL